MALVLTKKILQPSINLEAFRDILEQLCVLLEEFQDNLNSSELEISSVIKKELDVSDPEANFFCGMKTTYCFIETLSISSVLEYEKNIINNFVNIVFEKQFGWTDRCSSAETVKEDDPYNMKIQLEVNTLCDKFITWFEHHNHLSYNLLLAYHFALKSVSSSPVVRKQIILSAFRWFKNLGIKWSVIVVQKCYCVLKKIVISGLTDVWSAIRKDTSSRIGIVLELLCEERLEDFFMELIQICRTGKAFDFADETWQSTEGAIRGIHKVLTSCKYIAKSSVRQNTTHSPSLLIKIGKCNFESLPLYMKDNLETALFKLFAHSQYSVREIAGRTFADLLQKSEFSCLMHSFDKVIHHLGKKVPEEQANTSVLKFMDACKAEGFMNAVLFLIKSVPLTYLICNWLQYWSIFSHYLIHPASTVRQTASTVFKYLVSKDLTSPNHMNLVLQGLCSKWKTNIENLTKETQRICEEQERQSILDPVATQDITCCWEWREGRLFAYELIMKFLITNHAYFTSTAQNKKVHGSATKNTINFHNSIAEGQLKSALSSQLSVDMISLSSRSNLTQKPQLSKSFTQSHIFLEEKEPLSSQKNISKLPSIINLSRTGCNKEDPYLQESISEISFTQFPVLPRLVEMSQTEQNSAEQKVSLWLSEQKYAPFRNLLKQILLQTIECLQDSRWELRRMSRQLLPNVCDVIRHLDYNILEELFSTSLLYPHSKLYYGSLLCLLNCSRTFMRLKKFQLERISPTKIQDRRKLSNELILTDIEKNISMFVLSVSNHISVKVAVESNLAVLILMLHQLIFKKEPVLDEIICQYFHSISAIQSGSDERATTKPLMDLLCECQTYLTDFCNQTPIQQTVFLLPVVLRSIHLSQSNSLDINIMLNCCEVIVTHLADENKNYLRQWESILISSCTEVSHIVNQADLEHQDLRQLFSIVYHLQSLLADRFPYSLIVNVVTAILSNINASKVIIKQQMPTVKSRLERASQSDDLLSYSTTSFDSMRMSDSNSSESESEKDFGNDEGSDWDWSSSDETDKDETSLCDIYSTFLKELNNRNNAAVTEKL